MKNGMFPRRLRSVCILKTPLSWWVLCPWTMFETQLNSTAIKSINHFIKTKPEVIFRVELLCSLNQTLSKVMIDSPIFLLIHLTECRARDKTQTCVVKLLLKCSQYRLVSLKTLLRCELSESHNHKLDAAWKLYLVAIPLVSGNGLSGVILWEKRH